MTHKGPDIDYVPWATRGREQVDSSDRRVGGNFVFGFGKLNLSLAVPSHRVIEGHIVVIGAVDSNRVEVEQRGVGRKILCS